MSCNLAKCKELAICKKNVLSPNFKPVNGITQLSTLKILGVTFQNNGRFLEHIRLKLAEANKCLYIIRCLRQDGYTQTELDYFFKSIVLSKILYGIVIYAASSPEMTTIQRFLTRCFKRKYISTHLNIYTLLEKTDLNNFKKISTVSNHPLLACMPKVKETSRRLRSQSCLFPKVNTERFKQSFVNRLIFRYNLAVDS